MRCCLIFLIQLFTRELVFVGKCDYYRPLILSNYLKNTIFGGFRYIYFNLLILVVNHMSWKFHDMNINPMTKCAYTFSKARILLTEISLSVLNYNQFSKIALVWVLVYTDRQEPVYHRFHTFCCDHWNLLQLDVNFWYPPSFYTQTYHPTSLFQYYSNLSRSL